VRIRDALDDLGDEGLVGLARYDGDCRCRAVNEVLADAVGVPVRAQVGRRPGELEGPWAAEAEALLRRVLATGKPVSHHAVIVRPSAGAGTVASSSWSTVWLPTRNADGTVNGVALLAIQVPGTDSALARLERAEARYRSLGDVGALDVVHLDADGRLDVDVPRWRQLTGQTPEQVADDGWLDAVHPDDRPRTAAEWERARATAQPSALEYRLRTAGGGERLVEGRLVPLVEDGRVVEWVGTTRDVTQERLNAAKRDRYARAAARSAARMERLQQATAALAGAVTTDDVAAAVLAQGRLAFGAAAGSVLLLEPDGESLRFAIRDNVCLFVGSREELERTSSGALTGPLAAATGDRAWAVVPLATTGPPVGALALAFRVEREFSEEDQAFLVALAGQCAQALDRARLYDRVVAEAAEARAAGDRLEVLARATAEVNAALDVEAALAALADVVVPRLADVCAVYVVGGRTPPGARRPLPPAAARLADDAGPTGVHPPPTPGGAGHQPRRGRARDRARRPQPRRRGPGKPGGPARAGSLGDRGRRAQRAGRSPARPRRPGRRGVDAGGGGTTAVRRRGRGVRDRARRTRGRRTGARAALPAQPAGRAHPAALTAAQHRRGPRRADGRLAVRRRRGGHGGGRGTGTT